MGFHGQLITANLNWSLKFATACPWLTPF